MGVLLHGAQRSWSGIGAVESAAGDTIMVNPGEMHDGLPVRGAERRWHMLYLDPDLVARELGDGTLRGAEIARPSVRDPALARAFLGLFARVTATAPDPLALDEALLVCLARVRRRHWSEPAGALGLSPTIRIAKERLDDRPAAATSLSDLAVLAGTSRFQLLRGFVRELGATPHAYLVQQRVRLARRLLAGGLSPAATALECGFADQSHMTRAFARQLGVTPGRYRAALA
jgi:AraC-like DNA-binding protein